MTLMKSPQSRPHRLARWRSRLPGNGRLSTPLAVAGGAAALTVGAAAIVVAASGLLVMGLGLLAAGTLALGVYWLRAKRNGIWVHVLVDTDDVVISLALPLPLALIRKGLQLSPASDETMATVRMILEDEELLKTLREDAIEIIAQDGDDYIEVVIGARRKKWRAFQFKPVRSFSQTKTIAPSQTEEFHHV